MSIIFSGLERVEQGSEDQLNWYYFDTTDVTTIEGELNPMMLLINNENEILLNQCFESEYDQNASTEIITTCEKYQGRLLHPYFLYNHIPALSILSHFQPIACRSILILSD